MTDFFQFTRYASAYGQLTLSYNVSESENVEPHSKSEVQRIDSNDLYVLTKTFSCLSISVPLPHRAEYGALLWLVRLHAVCHIDKHYCRNPDSLESMAEPITGGGTFISLRMKNHLQKSEVQCTKGTKLNFNITSYKHFFIIVHNRALTRKNCKKALRYAVSNVHCMSY